MTGVLLVLALALAQPETPSPVEEAYAAARAGAWEVALERFGAALRAGGLAPGPLHYDRGTCCVRLGRLPEAVLHFRRARRHLGDDPRLRRNLRRLEGELGVLPEAPDGFVARLLHGFDHAASGLRVAAAATLQLAGLLGLLLLRGRLRRGAALAILLLGLLAAARILQGEARDREREAVVLRGRAVLRDEPDPRRPALRELRPGAVLRVVAASDRWVEVRGARDRGWVPRDAVGLVD